MSQHVARRRSFHLLASGAVLLLTLACAPAPSGERAASASASASAAASASSAAPVGAASGTSAAPPRKLRASYSGVQAVQSPMWLALEGGYFREEGLDVELTLITSGATLLAAMRGGDVELAGTGGSSMLLGYLEGLETQVIGAAQRSMDASIVGRPGTRTVEDLRGKTIGVNRLKSTNDSVTRLVLQRLGLQPDVDFHTRGTGGLPEALAALETGSVDAAILSMPFLIAARQRGYPEIVKIGGADGVYVPFLGGAIGATKPFLAANEAVVDGVMRALARGLHRFKTDREFAIRVFGKYTQTDDRDMLGATVDFYAPLLEADLYPDREAMQMVIEREEHPNARSARPEDVTDYRFADRLRASGLVAQ